MGTESQNDSVTNDDREKKVETSRRVSDRFSDTTEIWIQPEWIG